MKYVRVSACLTTGNANAPRYARLAALAARIYRAMQRGLQKERKRSACVENMHSMR
jgi:hypothetical protein